MALYTIIDPTVDAVRLTPQTVQTLVAQFPGRFEALIDPDGVVVRASGRGPRTGGRLGDWLVRYPDNTIDVIPHADFIATYKAV